MKNRLMLASLLSVCAFLANAMNVALFGSISFIFGSIFALIAVRILGLRWGALVAFIGASYTVYAWGHPYALIVFVLEVICVGFLLRRIDNLALADVIYWVVFGAGLVVMFYAGALDLPTGAALFIALKQALNGVFNAVIAGLMLVFLRPVTSLFRDQKSTIPIQSLMFKVLAFVGIFSCAVLITLESRSEYRQTLNQLENILSSVASWTKEEIGEGTFEEPYNLSGVPLPDHLFQFSQAEFDTTRDLSITIVQPDGEVIVLAGSPRTSIENGKTHRHGPSFTHWEPTGDMAAMVRSRRSYFVHTEDIDTASGTAELKIELSAAPVFGLLEEEGQNELIVLAVMMTMILGASYVLVKAISRPLKQLAKSSEELTHQIIEGGQLKPFHASGIDEFDTLSSTLWNMGESLSHSFKEQEALACTLEERIRDRTAQLDLMSRVAQQTTDAVVVTDTEGKTTWVNRSFVRLSGYTLEEMRGHSPGQILQKVPPSQDLREHMTACIARADSFHVELLNQKRDGTNYWIEIRCSPLLDSEGRHTGFIATQSDVTERRQLTQNLKDSLQRLRLATDVAELGVWVYQCNSRRLEWDYLNYRLHGLEVNAVSNLLEDWLAGIHDEDRQKIAELIETDFHFSPEPQTFEYRFMHPERGERVMIMTLRATSTEDGGERIIGATRDITDERMANQKIEEAASHTAAILDNVIDAVIAIDTAGHISSFNQAAEQMFGYSAEEILGHDVGMLMTGQHAARHKSYVNNYISTKKRKIIGNLTEFTATRKDGSTFPILLAVSEVKTANKHFFIGIIRDASLERQLQEQLRQSQKLEAVGQLTGGISHDFNNLLTVILGSAEMLVDSLDEQPQLKRPAEMIMNAAERGAELTSRLLSFSRRQPLSPKSVNVSALLREMDDLLRRSITQEIDIEITTSDAPCILELDPAQFEAAILNLTLNARDAMPDGGCLRIASADVVLTAAETSEYRELQPGRHLLIEVSDTGTGMSECQIASAFEPFYTTKQVGKGSGLGLSMVFGFVKQSGGHILIKSALEEGTTVKIYFPY